MFKKVQNRSSDLCEKGGVEMMHLANFTIWDQTPNLPRFRANGFELDPTPRAPLINFKHDTEEGIEQKIQWSLKKIKELGYQAIFLVNVKYPNFICYSWFIANQLGLEVIYSDREYSIFKKLIMPHNGSNGDIAVTPGQSERDSTRNNNTGKPKDKLLKVQEVARYLRIAIPTVYKLLREGDIPCIKIGGAVRVWKSDLDDFIRKNYGKGAR